MRIGMKFQCDGCSAFCALAPIPRDYSPACPTRDFLSVNPLPWSLSRVRIAVKPDDDQCFCNVFTQLSVMKYALGIVSPIFRHQAPKRGPIPIDELLCKVIRIL